ncbi:MAG: metallophosphoesterase family protein [Coriobacteriales bacterium]|nr:metallophosphatase family protein [Actinomycetes bacterium]
MLVGVLSDTHGALPHEVFDVFREVEHIVHAGDVGAQLVLDELETIAPVTAVAGNMDFGELARTLPAVASLNLDGTVIMVAHKAAAVLKAAESTDADLLISGHTHVASVLHSGRLTLLDPGSVTQPRGGGPGTVALVETGGEEPLVRLVTL